MLGVSVVGGLVEGLLVVGMREEGREVLGLAVEGEYVGPAEGRNCFLGLKLEEVGCVVALEGSKVGSKDGVDPGTVYGVVDRVII